MGVLFFAPHHLLHVRHYLREWNTATTLGEHHTLNRTAKLAHELQQCWIVRRENSLLMACRTANCVFHEAPGWKGVASSARMPASV